jgi:serine/threonine protein kinase
LHMNRVVHNDIKPANILIEANGCARLADFDVSVDAATRTHDAVIRATAHGAGTLGFIAPEVIQRRAQWLCRHCFSI